MKYGLSDKQLKEITDILASYEAVEQAILFGSRAIDTYKEASDVDIAIKGEKADWSLAMTIKDHFEEDTYLPFFFDVVAYGSVESEALKREIDVKGKVLVDRGVSGWREVRLGDFFKVKHGFAFKGGGITTDKTSQILVTPGNFHIGGGFKTDKFKYYIGEFPSDYLLKENDIIITMTDLSKETDTLGYSAKVPYSKGMKYLHNQRIGLVQFKNKGADSDFLYWLMRTRDYQGYIVGSASGTSIMHTSPTRIEDYEFKIPPLPKQKAIAEVLSSLDDKIDLLHRQNKTLEQMAETLFRQWFVEEAGEDWEEGIISDLVDFNPKRVLAKGTIAVYLEMASLNTQTFNPNGWYDREFKSGTKFINEDTLLARITPCLENGKTAYVTFLEENQVAWGSTEYIVMRPKEGIHPFFAYTLARNKNFREYAEGCLAGSSGRQRIDLEHLKNFDIPIPSQNIIEDFNNMLETIVPKLKVNATQICTLESLRDTLLPKLMSGEVRVEYGKEVNQ